MSRTASTSQSSSQASQASPSPFSISQPAGLSTPATTAPSARQRRAAPPRIFPPLPASCRTAERETALAELHERMAACRACMLAGYLDAANAVAGYRGRIGDRALVIGQAPGHLSVERNRPFSGPGGRVLDSWLQRAGFAAGALHREVYISALTRCDPGKNPRGGGDRKPSPPELALCRRFWSASWSWCARERSCWWGAWPSRLSWAPRDWRHHRDVHRARRRLSAPTAASFGGQPLAQRCRAPGAARSRARPPSSLARGMGGGLAAEGFRPGAGVR